MSRIVAFLPAYCRVWLAFTLSFCLVRLYEYFLLAAKFFVPHPYSYELAGLLYDVWAAFIIGVLLLLPYLLLSFIHQRLAKIVLHIIHVLLLMMYIALLITFSERNTPFDHEFFTRSGRESWLTTKQMMTSGITVYLPFIVFVSCYFIVYAKWFKNMAIGRKLWVGIAGVAFIATVFMGRANPSENWFKQTAAYYLTSNKLSFWAYDSYHYFATKGQFDASNLTPEQLQAEIDFYQQNQPFAFTNKEYPLLRSNNDKDVLGSFFNLDKTTPPNIVLLVVEGLSRDFSGRNAYASSFTPFLDSLANKSLAWDNFLSTAPGTFAAHPALSGSLPYGRRGFSLIGTMPNHLSLIKLMRTNGYHTKFLVGFNPDFDNMGGYIRLQGTDFMLSKYGPKYKEMGMGKEGWSMGYPDDALYSRSFEVMDSLKAQPYFNIFHTGTTHMPYLFEQKPQYEKLFDKKLKTLAVSPEIKKTLKDCKHVLVTFMFSDDCIRQFFKEYAKRPEYKNTIFFITGDHHIGSFPSTGSIDDYHVPLIIYSPMLKAPKRFLSVNSHNNIAPTITALLQNNYKLPYQPKEVNWVGGVLDTCASFRNIHAMPFMAWSREIDDYIYKEYLLSGTQLFKLSPTLLQEPYDNDSLKQHITKLRDNYKRVNSYVCDNNKIFPTKLNPVIGERQLLYEFNEPKEHHFYTKSNDTAVMPIFKIPNGYKNLYIEMDGDVNLLTECDENDNPALRFGLIDTKDNGKNYVYWTNRNIFLMTNDFKMKQWNHVSTNDLFTLEDYKQYHELVFELAIYTQLLPMNVQMKNMKVKVYGVR